MRDALVASFLSRDEPGFGDACSALQMWLKRNPPAKPLGLTAPAVKRVMRGRLGTRRGRWPMGAAIR